MKTAEEIFDAIDNQSVSRAIGVNLIEEYGNARARKSLEEIDGIVEKANAELDELIEKAGIEK
jgi:hypothetical protein